jgi:outer membrane protease
MRKRRNRTRVHCAFGLVLWLVSAVAPASADDFTLSASTSTGVLYGVAKEFVYSTSDFNGKSYTLSELEWEVKPLFYAGASLELSTLAGLTASLDVRMGVPGKTGSSTDSDWLNYNDNGDPVKTNFIFSDCYTERAILLDAQVGWQFPLASWLSLEPFAAFGLMDFKWTARDGYFQYPPGWFGAGASKPYPPASTRPKEHEAGACIIYEQTWFIPAAGITATFNAGKVFRISASFAITPFVFCNDVDNHEFEDSIDFYDTMRGGLLLEPKVTLEWQVSRRARLSLDVSYMHIAGLLGDTSKVDTGFGRDPDQEPIKYSDGAGASFDVLDASLSFSLSL